MCFYMSAIIKNDFQKLFKDFQKLFKNKNIEIFIKGLP